MRKQRDGVSQKEIDGAVVDCPRVESKAKAQPPASPQGMPQLPPGFPQLPQGFPTPGQQSPPDPFGLRRPR